MRIILSLCFGATLLLGCNGQQNGAPGSPVPGVKRNPVSVDEKGHCTEAFENGYVTVIRAQLRYGLEASRLEPIPGAEKATATDYVRLCDEFYSIHPGVRCAHTEDGQTEFWDSNVVKADCNEVRKKFDL